MAIVRDDRRRKQGEQAVRDGPWSSRQWCAYFRANATRLLELPWQLAPAMSPDEKATVAASLQDFQLGEQSEGRHLLRRAAAHAARVGDPHYEEAVALFIAEEQRHARDLGRVLSHEGIPLLQRSRLDGVFRLLRRLAGLELMLVVLLTAEAIGMVYYLAIRRASRSALLRRLCDQLSRDEVQHLRFHAERLARLRSGRSRWRVGLACRWHRALLWGTCVLVWCKHRQALRAGGLTFGRFLRECRRTLAGVLHRADPRRYRR